MQAGTIQQLCRGKPPAAAGAPGRLDDAGLDAGPVRALLAGLDLGEQGGGLAGELIEVALRALGDAGFRGSPRLR
jgi:hypothetical protein